MVQSSITNIFLRIADERLEKSIDEVILLQTDTKSINNPSGPRLKDKNLDIMGAVLPCCADLRKDYCRDIGVLDEAGKSLAELSMAYEPIDGGTAFQKSYNKIIAKYVQRYRRKR